MGIDDLTNDQQKVLTALNVAFSSLSFAGSTFIIICFLSFRDLRKFSFQLVFWLSISDALNCLGNFLGHPHGATACYLQAVSTQFFSVCSFLWTTVIAFVLHRTVVEHKPDVASLGARFHLFVWGSGCLLAALPATTSSYGPTGAAWCWIKNSSDADQAMRMFVFYLPLWGAILFNCFVYMRVIRILRFTMKVAMGIQDQQRRLEMTAVHRLGFYPLILIVVWLVPTLNRMQNFIEPHHPKFALYCVHVSLASLQGFFNSLAYGLNTSVRRSLQEFMCGYCDIFSPSNAFVEMEDEDSPELVEMNDIARGSEPATDGMVDVPLDRA
mmetsp:Transcript_14452/g.27767  ORF Transcript_14452/g.27767 Transcript_14452/m.27767 type:complete len:326 (-) Transcript_14452:100-1077(-)|eukprot:CAMPEP_0114235686 /NCGR_PEP_ID=MMETSP0058-20121206/6388_1 /TAXON_ID=36894 /ORGANISM="Pyramimonas parkeae, CCMP726" /LENGTH=325 /DNA_ID=CAMNT_0001347475 /DNA_START=363 /DNA_END=1340 /DNA_ORIENTATION=+